MSTLRLLVAALRSLTAFLAVATYTLLVGPPALLLTFLLKTPAILYWAAPPAVRLGLALAGIRYRVEGAEHILRDRPAIYCVNHSSNVEPPVVFLALDALFPRVKLLYKAELRRLPILGRVFEMGGFVAINRHSRAQSMEAIDAAVASLQAGNNLVIFPEGTRSPTGQLLPFKKGGFIMALKARVPVVPTAVQGARAAMRKGSPVIWPVTVRVSFAPPVETDRFELDDRHLLVETVRREISRMLGQAAPDPDTADAVPS